MASSTTRDPRLNGASKRPASRSPDGSISSSLANKRPTGPSRKSSANSHKASDASPIVGRASHETKAPMVVVEEFFNATTTAAELSIELKAAQAEYAKAEREFRNMQEKFDQFPAIKEQKTQARNRAQSKLGNIERLLNEQKPRQNHVMAALAGLLGKSGPEPGNYNSASLQEVHSIKSQVNQVPSLQSSVSRLEPRVSELERTMRESRTADSAVNSRLKALENPPIKESGTSVSTLERLEDLGEAVKKIPVDVSERVKQLEKAVTDAPIVTNALGKRIDAMERANSIHTSRTQALESSTPKTITAAPPVDLIARVQTLENHARNGTPALEGAIGERLSAIETRMNLMAEDSAADKDGIIEGVDEFKEQLKEDLIVLKTEINDLVATTATRLDADLAVLRTAATKTLDHNALAINDCMDRLKEVVDNPLSDPNPNPESLRQTLLTLQERLKGLEKPKASTAPAMPSTGTTRSTAWQPVLPDNDDEGAIEPQINGSRPANGNTDSMSRMYNEIEMLKGVTTQHSRVINNLTTDELVRQMVDQMSQMYPESRNFQQAANNLRSDLQTMAQRLTELRGIVNTTAASLSQLSPRVPNFDGDIGQEVTKLQTNYAGLLQRVGQHDSVLDDGKERLRKVDELAGDVKQLTAGAQSVHEHLKKHAELQMRLLKVEDAVRSVSAANGVDKQMSNGSG